MTTNRTITDRAITDRAIVGSAGAAVAVDAGPIQAPGSRRRRGRHRLLASLALSFGLVSSACAGATDSDTGVADTDTGDAANDGESSSADQGAAGDDGQSAATGTSTGDGQAASPDGAGSVECAVVDDRLIEVTYTNPGSVPVDLDGEIGVTAGSASDVVRPGIRGVAPGEKVAITVAASPASPDPLDGCSTDGLTIVPRSDLDPDWSADVGPCTDFREDLLGLSAFDVTVTNPSETVPAHYEITVVVRDPEGTRRANSYVLANAHAEELAPGETVARSETIIFSFDDFGPGHTCEVGQVVRHTSVQVLADEGGVVSGSLEADVAFDTGSAELSSDGVALLNKIVERVAEHDGPICVEGFADSVGDDAANQTLSQDRAESVRDHLVSSGVTNTIEPIGYGEAEATVDEVDDPTLRRVDITLAACTG